MVGLQLPPGAWRLCTHPAADPPAVASPAAHPLPAPACVQWAALEGGCRALAYTSGMAALAVVTKLVSVGGHIVAGDDIYGGTSRLLSQVVPAAGVSVSNVDMTDLT